MDTDFVAVCLHDSVDCFERSTHKFSNLPLREAFLRKFDDSVSVFFWDPYHADCCGCSVDGAIVWPFCSVFQATKLLEIGGSLSIQSEKKIKIYKAQLHFTGLKYGSKAAGFHAYLRPPR